MLFLTATNGPWWETVLRGRFSFAQLKCKQSPTVESSASGKVQNL